MKREHYNFYNCTKNFATVHWYDDSQQHAEAIERCNVGKFSSQLVREGSV